MEKTKFDPFRKVKDIESINIIPKKISVNMVRNNESLPIFKVT